MVGPSSAQQRWQDGERVEPGEPEVRRPDPLREQEPVRPGIEERSGAEMICVTMAYGTVKVVMRMARFRLTVYPMLKNVARNPEAIPRRDAGTDPMIELMFGDAKKPRPAPKSIM